MPFDILGDTFLKNVYAIFDQGNKRFGCVQRIEPESKKVGDPNAVEHKPADGDQGTGSTGSGLKDLFSKWLQKLLQLLGFA